MRYVRGYVRRTTHRYATHTVRRYVCNMVKPLRGRIRVQQPFATACAPREVPGEWRPALLREALRESTGNRLRVASPVATSWRLGEATGGGPPCVQHGDAPCTLPCISPEQPRGSNGDVSSCAAPGCPGDRLANGSGCTHGVVAPAASPVGTAKVPRNSSADAHATANAGSAPCRPPGNTGRSTGDANAVGSPLGTANASCGPQGDVSAAELAAALGVPKRGETLVFRVCAMVGVTVSTRRGNR